MSLFIQTTIAAPAAEVTAIMIDVERWHEWTASITSVTLREGGPLREGSRAIVRQPKLPPATWTVTALDPARGFTWVSSGPGFRVTGHHYAEAIEGGTRATLGLEYSGVLGPLIARLTRGITRRYVQMEANGLKSRAEQLTPETMKLRP